MVGIFFLKVSGVLQDYICLRCLATAYIQVPCHQKMCNLPKCIIKQHNTPTQLAAKKYYYSNMYRSHLPKGYNKNEYGLVLDYEIDISVLSIEDKLKLST